MTLKRVELRQRIYTEIKENIICGKYVRGQRLIETQIATEYGVNKANIREVLENAIFEDFLTNADQTAVDQAKLFTQRKIALLKAGLKEEAHKETLSTFEIVYANTSYQRMVNILRMYREYVDLMIHQAFEGPDDVSMTIQNSTLLYEVLEKRDIEMVKQWTHIRYQNAVNKAKLSKSFRERT